MIWDSHHELGIFIRKARVWIPHVEDYLESSRVNDSGSTHLPHLEDYAMQNDL